MKRFGKKGGQLTDACCADCFDSWHSHAMIQKKAFCAKAQALACTPSSAWTPQGWGRLVQISQLDDMMDEARHRSSDGVKSAKDLKSSNRVA